jgi:hypothetical protein
MRAHTAFASTLSTEGYSAATLTEKDPRHTKVCLWIIAPDGIIRPKKYQSPA